jgi:predicted RecA/RadA family phage recombinase
MASNVYNSNNMIVRPWTNAGTAVSADDIVVIGSTGDATLAVALVDIAQNATGSVGVNCGVTVDKVSAAVFKQGESLIWDSSVGKFDDNQATPASGDVSGSCLADADGANLETSCNVWLTGIPGTLTA